MRKLTQLVLVAAAMMATPAFAEMKIAVMNYQMALLESDAAKKYAVDAEKKFGPQLNKLKQLEADAKAAIEKVEFKWDDYHKNQLAQAEAEALAASKAFDEALDEDDDWDDEDDDGVEVIYVRD